MPLQLNDLVDPGCNKGVLEKGHCVTFVCMPETLIIKYSLVKNNKTPRGHFYIVNKTNAIQRVGIKGPKSNFFKVHLDENLRLFPGKRAKVAVLLDHLGDHQLVTDRVSIMCQEKCCTTVTLKGHPLVSQMQKIPQVIDFGLVPVGQTAIKKFTLKPIDKPMNFTIISPIFNPDLTISPLKGDIGDEPVEITVCYTPNSYITLNVPIHLYLPKILCVPYLIKIFAHTKPGALRDKALKEAVKKSPELQPRAIIKRPPLTVHTSHEQNIGKAVKAPPKPEDPPAWSHHKTNKLMLAPYEDPTAKFQLIGPLNLTTAQEMEIKKKNEKELRDEAAEIYKKNIIAMSSVKELREKIVEIPDRVKIWQSYNENFKHPPWESITEPAFIRKRFIRPIIMRHEFTFTDVYPDLWFVKYLIIGRFIEAGRKIIILNRLLKVLYVFKTLTQKDIMFLEGYETTVTDEEETVSKETTTND